MQNNRVDKNYYYIFSMSLVFMFFYSVIILTNSSGIYEIAENMDVIKKIYPIIIVAAFVVSMKFAIDGIMQVLIKHREKLGIYSLAGNRNIFLAYIIMIDLSKSVLIASAFGIVLGTIYSQLVIKLLELIFGITDISINIISAKIIIEYCFLIISIMLTNYLMSCFILKKMDIKDLMYNENILKTDDATIDKMNMRQYLIITVIMFCLMSFLIFVAIKNILYDFSVYYMLLGLFFGSCVIYRTTKIMIIVKLNRHLRFMPGKFYKYMFSNEVKRNWKSYYRNQCIAITILSLASLILFVSLTIGYSYKENIAKEAPFDLAVSVDAQKVNFKDIKKKLDTENISDEIEYKIYLNKGMEKYNLPKQFMKLSDYNYLRKLLNKEPIYLENKHFLIQVEDSSVEERLKKVTQDTQIKINNERYFLSKEIENFPFLQSNINGQFELLVFNDEEIDSMDLPIIRNVYIAKFSDPPIPKLKNELFKALKSSADLVEDVGDGHITIKVVLKEWSRLNGLVALSTFTILGIFLGSILMLIAVSSIAFSSIKNLEKVGRENRIYFNLGWSLKEIREYNNYRIKEYFQNSINMILLSLIPTTILLYLLLKEYLDKDGYVFFFSIISFCLYVFIMFGYRMSLQRILFYRK